MLTGGLRYDQYENRSIEMHGCRPRHREIEEVLSRCQRDSSVCHTTEVEEGLMAWPVQQKPEDVRQALPRACSS